MTPVSKPFLLTEGEFYRLLLQKLIITSAPKQVCYRTFSCFFYPSPSTNLKREASTFHVLDEIALAMRIPVSRQDSDTLTHKLRSPNLAIKSTHKVVLQIHKERHSRFHT